MLSSPSSIVSVTKENDTSITDHSNEKVTTNDNVKQHDNHDDNNNTSMEEPSVIETTYSKLSSSMMIMTNNNHNHNNNNGPTNTITETPPPPQTTTRRTTTVASKTETTIHTSINRRCRKKVYGGCQDTTTTRMNLTRVDSQEQESLLGIAFPTTQEFENDDFDIGQAKFSLFSNPSLQVDNDDNDNDNDDNDNDDNDNEESNKDHNVSNHDDNDKEEEEETFDKDHDNNTNNTSNDISHKGRTKKKMMTTRTTTTCRRNQNGDNHNDNEPKQVFHLGGGEMTTTTTTTPIIDTVKQSKEKEEQEEEMFFKYNSTEKITSSSLEEEEQEEQTIPKENKQDMENDSTNISVTNQTETRTQSIVSTDHHKESQENKSTTTNSTTHKDDPLDEQEHEQEQQKNDETNVPDEETLIKSTDRLFVNCDTDSMTVGDIIRSLEFEFNMTITKPFKKIVRNRLKALIRGQVKPMTDETNQQEEQEEESSEETSTTSSSSQDQDEQQEETMEESSSEEEEEEDVSDYEEEEHTRSKKKTTTRRPPNKKNPVSQKKRKPKLETRRRTTRSSTTTHAAGKKKASAMRIHAEMLRKKRIEELRVRNEELQLAQNKQDEERAEQIAQKFETNTQELQRKRLEDRLDLLTKLDQKRIQVISIQDDKDDKQETNITIHHNNNNNNMDDHENVPTANEQPKTTSVTTKVVDSPPSVARTDESSEEEEEDGESSDDELELEILGGKGNKFIPSIANRTSTSVTGFLSTSTTTARPEKSNALSVLDRADKSQKTGGGHHHGTKNNTTLALSSSPKKKDIFSFYQHKTTKNPQKPTSSPGKSLHARRALREALQSKQRKAGNMWLARELGYKTEEEHLRDCRLAEQQKRERIIKSEAERLKQNELKQLRERLFLEGSEDIPPEGDEEGDEQGEGNDKGDDTADGNDPMEEMDEEMAMAKAIQDEQNDQEKQMDKISSSSDENELEIESPTEQESLNDDADADADAYADVTKDALAEVENKMSDNSEEPESKEERMPEQEETAANDIMDPIDQPKECNKNEKDASDAESGDTLTNQNGNGDESKLNVTIQDPSFETNKSETEGTEAIGSLDEGDGSTSQQEDEENEYQDEAQSEHKKKPRNAAWQAMLQKEAEQLKKARMNKGSNKLVEAEADEEEEEFVMGLEDFGFSLHKKKKEDDEEEEAGADKLGEDDLKNIVDEVSDDEGDEEAGEDARKEMERKEEKERHKEMLRRMRDGYDGRRGGIAGGGAGARGIHRFDQLVAADNREEGKRLGLANDDEFDSDNEGETEMKDGEDDNGEIEDETALLDKMLKDRFLHRSSVELEENFSEDEEEEEEGEDKNDNDANNMDEDEKEQERLAKQFAKRARMQRLLETYREDEEFTQSRLIDEDESMKSELRRMKSVMAGSKRHNSTTSSKTYVSAGSDSQLNEFSDASGKKRTSEVKSFNGSFLAGNGKLSLALKASKRTKQKTSFLGGTCKIGKDSGASIHKSVALNHVVFQTGDTSQHSQLSRSSVSFASSQRSTTMGKRKRTTSNTSTSLWSKVSANSFKKRR